MQGGDGSWVVPSPGQTKIKGVPKMVPLNGLAYEALFGKTRESVDASSINGETGIHSSIPNANL